MAAMWCRCNCSSDLILGWETPDASPAAKKKKKFINKNYSSSTLGLNHSSGLIVGIEMSEGDLICHITVCKIG